MIEKAKIDLINKEFGEIPDILYHGRYEYPISKEKLKEQIKIFESKKEIENISSIKLKKYGRTHLDCAFHGFYLTPCMGQAVYWALTKPYIEGKEYQIIKIKKIKDVKDLNIKINIVPDLDWCKFIIQNRCKMIDYNQYDLVYNYMADGKIANIVKFIEENNEYDEIRVHKELLENRKKFLDMYYDNNSYEIGKIIACLELYQYKNYQLCISSNKALRYFEIDDIIILPNDYLKKNNLHDRKNICNHIKEKFGYNIIEKEKR